ncbi:hypothetical protein CCYN2B_10019 [Capnocytophaga cynodegmi]|uniref:Uncharacterized protein n=1 Tax=Capnocytophaga cynodegmi TaxID=28189 RepID=A0A0B7H1B6_9FLAO|nr:hypothetical protein CCYN2B_10019 [Capnocytophaga cynodegmi]
MNKLTLVVYNRVILIKIKNYYYYFSLIEFLFILLVSFENIFKKHNFTPYKSKPTI